MMSLATNGGYDKVVELDQTLLTAIARETFEPTRATTTIAQSTFEATVDSDVRLHALWLGVRNERWLPAELGADDALVRPARWLPSPGQDERPQRQLATITLDVNLVITIARLQNLNGDWVRPIDVYCGQADPVARRECEARQDRQDAARRLATIEFAGYIDVTGTLDAEVLTVRTDRDRPRLTEQAWCAILSLYGVNFPRIEVVIDEARIARALPIRLSAIAAGVTGGAAAAQAAIAETTTSIRQGIADAVRGTLAVIHDWRQDRNATIVLHAATKPPPDTGPCAGLVMTPQVTRMDVASLNRVERAQLGSSLVIGMQTQSSGGAMLFLRESQLQPGDTMAVTVPHAPLIRDTLVPAMLCQFNGLTIRDINVPLARRWLVLTKGEVTVSETTTRPPPSGTSTFTLTSLLVFVDNIEQVRIVFGINAVRYGGAITATATIDLHLGFSATVRGAGTGQEVVVTPSILNPETAVTEKNAAVAPWVYLVAGGLGAVIGGSLGFVLGVIVVGILDATVAESSLRDQLGQKVQQGNPGGTANPLPADVILTSTGVSLFQADAAALTDPPWPMLGIRDHDLVLRFSHTLLPRNLAVICQVPDASDPGSRIDGIGVVDASTTATTPTWRLPIDTAIQMIQAGTHTFVARNVFRSVPDAPIVVVSGDPPYLRTVREGPRRPADPSNNLGNLPRCLP